MPDGAHITSPEKASSVPGRMQTAVVESSGVANPRVPVLKLWVVSLSPTFAGRDLTLCRLKSHMAEELLSLLRAPHQPRPVSKKRANKPARTAGKRPVRQLRYLRLTILTHYGDFASASSCPSPASDFSNSPPAFASRRTLATGCFCLPLSYR